MNTSIETSRYPSLSVIIPAYNAAATIDEQLDALKAQTYKGDWEVIVVNNQSTDETLTVVEQFRDRLPNLRILNACKKKGAAYARNLGATAAKGEMLAFCDADDLVGPGWVAAMGTALAKYDFVAGRLEANRLNEPWILKVRHCPQQKGLQEYKYPPYLPHSASANLGVKRVIHEDIGGFDETLSKLQDTDYCWRLQLSGVKLHFVPQAVVHYRLRSSLAKTFRQARVWGEYNVLLYKRYRSSGMPKLLLKDGVKAWKKMLRRLFRIRSQTDFFRWLWTFNWRIGRLWGCIKYRVIAL